MLIAVSSLLASDVLAETVRTVIPRSTVNYLSVPVAEAKGFFRTEGLENETIVIPGSTAIAALVRGSRCADQSRHVSDGKSYLVSDRRS